VRAAVCQRPSKWRQDVKVKVLAVNGDRRVEVKAVVLCSDNVKEGIQVFWGLEVRKI